VEYENRGTLFNMITHPLRRFRQPAYW